ncbi:MAG: radical SAM protein [Nitrospirota bacterium]
MPNKILLITPPFTQLNTPYPASPYLKGFLKMHGYDVFQADLGIELINKIFSGEGFQELFSRAKDTQKVLSGNSHHIISNEQYYLQTVGQVMDFLQYRDNTLAHILCSDTFLPRASRFDQLPDLDLSFGNIGVNDRARFLATRYVEDIGDLIKDAITPDFGFSRYAEKLGMSAHSFAPIDDALRQPDTLIEVWLLELLQKSIEQHRPAVVGITIPFPGNLYAGLKCGQFIKRAAPHIKIIAGGGFVNTELRELSEPAVFNYVDFITLDDGELPLLGILSFLHGEADTGALSRTFIRTGDEVVYYNADRGKDLSPSETGCPDYSDLPLDRYLSLIEIANPMHRLWSDGLWNKLAIAHGCYWHRCSFCDTTLDYINRCASTPAAVLVDRIEQVMVQTGQSGFHFVDEAAPPAALKELALELLRRKISISWWTNIRFENAFTRDLCRLLAASGCIAVTGGLEAASDRLLKLMNKGVTVRQAARACRDFTDAGIMVHAYLMYGFPTQTGQETIDALEIVRQFFSEGLIQSAFWHLFTATVHSDVGIDPGKYLCTIAARPAGRFAKNDLVHEDPTGCDHRSFAQGLNKAVYNYMHGIGMDLAIKTWFDVRVPAVSVNKDFVERAIKEGTAFDNERLRSGVLWLESLPRLVHCDPANKREPGKYSKLVFPTRTESFTLTTRREVGQWLYDTFPRFSAQNTAVMTLEELKQEHEKRFAAPFRSFLRSKEWKTLREKGLLLI